MGATLLAWLAKSALMTSPLGGIIKAIGRLLGKIPPKVWLALIVGAALFIGWKVHTHKVTKFGEERYTSGFEAGYHAAEEDQRKVTAKTNAATAAIAQDERGKNHEANARTNAAADDLRLRGPGKASSRCPTVAAPASGHDAPGGQSADAATGLPERDWTTDRAEVPWGWLVSSGQTCDLNRNEVIAWRSWYERIAAAWPKPNTSVNVK